MSLSTLLAWEGEGIGWMVNAECRDMDTNAFFAEDHKPYPKEVVEACARCKVIEDCLWYANESSSAYGYFAGMTPMQRRQWRKKNRVQLGETKRGRSA
jgi:predicted RecB family nuclease